MRHVTIRQLRTFSEVLRRGSFAAAAQALHLTPPAVTLQMKQLEEAAGMPLAGALQRPTRSNRRWVSKSPLLPSAWSSRSPNARMLSERCAD